jgi:carbohydrate binding protein with CBM6 domain
MKETGPITKTRGAQLTKNELSHDAGNLAQTLCALLLGLIVVAFVPAGAAEHYRGRPFHDSAYHSGPQKIPGRVQCAYYDLGGEGIAYHDTDAKNKGSGTLNPADGSYLNEFRMHEGVDTSYTKYHDDVDENPYEAVHPPKDQLYVGWTDPGEWFNMTVKIEQAGLYQVSLLYTSKLGGTISLALNGKDVSGPIKIETTYNAADPIAWRQWHHWNYAKNLATVTLPKGTNVLTLRIESEGNMNLAYLDFSRAE